MLDREELARAPDAGLDLIGDEQRTVFLAKLRHTLEVAVIGEVHALALDRLDEEAANFLGLKRVFERVKIVERHLHAIGQETLEAFAGESGRRSATASRRSGRGRRGCNRRCRGAPSPRGRI